MADSPLLITLAQWLAGEFDNQLQARERPVWFVHLRMWQRPLAQRIQGKLALFAEQANVLSLDRPYRQRVLTLQETSDGLQGQYWALKEPGRFQGAGANVDLLKQLSHEDLESLPGCVLRVRQEGHRFAAQPPADARCYFQYEGQTRQVVLGFQVSAEQFWSYDKGVDPETGQGLWGALIGPYEYHKCQSFAAELPI
ncbi:chromophore lyase CpcT/CpeT [Oscillatoria sp. FACHB-1407]|uniref:chromophore lyase CpcT/CpeT n=1 Tax=Oscillatoria sp. FACHB-1407 TaxID=2692847 RepID=UPI0016861871|nr:chromophore lyase CpcT/CpeT [Oscillatoria sp. FACHB-1407]MBD2462969.1 chromophore lyase CpcT/CpeT [Oscillatoria sp. FACHB-1407]